MPEKAACIYCGIEADLSESDIIPDALTNARITNKNVCKTEHNNKFSDLFESKVIKALAFITNELDVKSKKGKNYASYPAKVEIAGVEYEVSKTSDRSIFDGRVLKSTDKKYMMSSLDNLKRIVKNPEEVEFLDVNSLMIEQKISINLDIYFCEEMFRMVSKVAFEWYCAKNGVSGYHQEFENIVSYITTGQGKNPVTIIQNAELYKFYEKHVDLGSHSLFVFQGKDNKVNVVFSLFGIAMYRVIVADKIPAFCRNNFMYLELRTDSSRKEIIKESYEQAKGFFESELTNKDNFVEGPIVNGVTLMLGKQTMNADVIRYPFVLDMIKCLAGIHDDTVVFNKEIKDILLHNINNITQASLLHKKAIKRFVKEYFYEGHEPLKLNPVSTNKKTTFFLYILFAIGVSGIETIDDSGLQEIAKRALCLGADTEFVINNEVEKNMREIIVNIDNYSEILEKGADVIKEWKE